MRLLFTCIKWSDENLPSYIVVVQTCLTLYHLMECSTPGFQSFTISQSLLKLMSIESMMPSNHSSSVAPFSSCPQSFPASGFFSNKSVLCSLWPKYWSDWHFFTDIIALNSCPIMFEKWWHIFIQAIWRCLRKRSLTVLDREVSDCLYSSNIKVSQKEFS